MSPIIDLQRRMQECGRIRAGDKGDKGQPQRLANWRLTSKDRQRLDGAARLWGGEVRPWEGHTGEFELYTETDSLPIMLLPGNLPTTWYELWSKGGCQRRCDGQHELISDSACLCGDERECKPTTRLSVLLPDLPGIGSWLLSSTGWNAAAELAGAADLLQRASAQGVLMPARLRLEQRTQISSGQTRKFAVPVLDVDVAFRDLLGGNQGSLAIPSERALPQGYIPITGNGGNGVSLSDGLKAAEEQTVTRTSRSAAPLPDVDDDITFGAGPVPVEDPGASTLPSSSDKDEAQGPEPPAKPLTLAQAKKKMNALVGQLRDGGHITTQQLYAAMAKTRNIDVATMSSVIEGAWGEDNELHWGPLRDSLTLDEARDLHARLARLWVNVQEPVA